MRRTFAAVLVAIGLILLVVLPAVWQLTRPDPVLGDVAAVESALRATVTTTPSADEPGRSPSSDPVPPGDAPDDVPLPEADRLPDGPPVGLRIERIAVDAPVAPYGVDARSGDMAVPSNVTEVAWYEFGPRPGEGGSAVLAAHVDLASQGPGVFFDLSELEPGDRVVVAYGGGDEVAFRVTARVVYDKSEVPLDVIFSPTGPPVLTLITCGGGFNRQAQSYDSNVVVYAVPDDGSASGVND